MAPTVLLSHQMVVDWRPAEQLKDGDQLLLPVGRQPSRLGSTDAWLVHEALLAQQVTVGPHQVQISMADGQQREFSRAQQLPVLARLLVAVA